jgi:outer membrane protein TolC
MMKSRLILAIACAVAFSFPVPPVAAQVPTVTLDEALELAQRYSPAIIQAEGNVRVAQATKRETISDWLPRLSGSSGWSINSSERFDPQNQITVSGSSTSMNGSLSASYTVFDGFRRNANSKARGADLTSAEASYVAQEFQIALQTKQAFFNAIAADELVRVSETRITRAERQLQTTRDRLAAGSAIRSDTLQSFVEWANARLQLINAQTQRATASANLARLIGYDSDVRAVPDESMQFIVDIDTALIRAEALAQGPDVEQVVASARAADAQVSVSRAAYFPSITASYSRSVAGQEFSNLRSSWSGRIGLNWQIFNGFGRETSVQRSRATQDAAHAQIEDTRRQVNAQLTQQFASLQSAAIRIEIADASLAAATEDLRVQQERYRLGAATILEVMQSQINVDQAEVDGVQARLDYFQAKAEIEAIAGRTI